MIIKQLGLEEAREVATPGEKEEITEVGEELSPEDAGRYRAIAARGNYLALDRVDIAYSAKELCRRMSCPSRRDWGRGD